MRLGIISDIHGNLEALETVLNTLKAQSIDQYICLGDIVDYGANPNECVNIIRELTDKVIAGNHDWAVVGLTDIAYFNLYAQMSVRWTEQQLAKRSIEYLKDLPLTLREGELTFVHATLVNPEDWEYVLSDYGAKRCLSELESGACFIGHSHQPFIYVEYQDGQSGILNFSSVNYDKEKAKYLINVGSVGQPRDLDPRAAFAVVDTERKFIEIHRIEYEVAKAQRKILDAGLPRFLATRLEYGE